MNDTFYKLTLAAYRAGEKNDCSVKAVSVVCNVDYETARTTLAKVGRQPGRGANGLQIKTAIFQLGFKAIDVDLSKFTAATKTVYNYNVNQPTTKHMAKFPKVWRDGKTYLVFVRGHVAAVVNGDLIDWSGKTALRISHVYEITEL